MRNEGGKKIEIEGRRKMRSKEGRKVEEGRWELREEGR